MIRDQNILDEMSIELNKDKRKIAKDDYTKIKKISLDYYGIDNEIFDIEKLPNIESLFLSSKYLRSEEVNKISSLKKLKKLYLSDIELETIEPLNNTNIETLHLNNCKIFEINKLNNLPKLKELYIENMDYIDLKNLKIINNLKILSIKKVRIINENYLINMKKLDTLILIDALIEKIELLNNIKTLKNIYTNIIDISKYIKNKNIKIYNAIGGGEQ